MLRPRAVALLALLALGLLLTACPAPNAGTPLSVVLTAIPASVTAPTTLTLIATPSGGASVAKVAFFRDSGSGLAPQQDQGESLGEDASPPYQVTLELTAADNGAVTFTAVATDTAGGAASGTVTVTVAIPDEDPPANAPPAIDDPPGEQRVIRNLLSPNLVSVAFGVSDPDGDGLTVEASSGDQAVVADGDLAPDCAAGACTLEFAPDPSADGAATVTLRVSDGAATAEASFEVVVESRQVLNSDDAGAGSLRATLAEAVSGDVVGFDAQGAFAAAATVALSSGPLVLVKDVTVEGTGEDTLTVSAGGASRVIGVVSGATVTLKGLTITGGDAPIGGGVHNAGTLTVENSAVSGNSAAFDGGGIYNDAGGVLTLKSSTVSGNEAVEDQESSDAGGILNLGELVIEDSTVRNNTAAAFAGGVGNGGDLRIEGGTVSGNAATHGGGVANSGTLSIVDSAIDGKNTAVGDGGGVLNLDGGDLRLVGSVVSGNMADEGGGVHNDGTLALIDSTVSKNLSSGNGGGVFSRSRLVMDAPSRVEENEAGLAGGGIYNDGGTLDGAVEGGNVLNNTPDDLVVAP